VPGKASHSPVAADSWRPLDATEPALESEKAPKYRVSLGWSERNFLSLMHGFHVVHKSTDLYVAPITIQQLCAWHSDGYPWDSFLPICWTFLCRSESFFITAIFFV
jgi:hypothetical protein